MLKIFNVLDNYKYQEVVIVNSDWLSAPTLNQSRRQIVVVSTPIEQNDTRNNKSFCMAFVMPECCDTGIYEMNDVFENGFYDDFEDSLPEAEFEEEYSLEQPTESNPMNICEFLSNLDLSDVLKVFSDKYGSVDYHFRYSMTAMMKSSIMRRIKNMRSFQKVVNRLKSNETDSKMLGFNGKIPNRRTFRHFENVRIEAKDLEESMNVFATRINKELEKNGEKITRIGIDSTPLKSLFKDPDATYNGHYEIRGYKIHGVYDVDRNIPLAVIVTDANTGDSTVFPQLLEIVKDCGIEFEEVYADGSYNSFENFAYVNLLGAKFYTKIPSNAVLSEKAEFGHLKQRYQKYHTKSDWKVTNDFDFIIEYLTTHGDAELVGRHLRNEYMKEWILMEELKKYHAEPSQYNKRNVVEGYHGWAKRFLNLEIYLDYRGMRNVERQVRWSYFGVMAMVLTRLQNGITDNLTQIAYLE